MCNEPEDDDLAHRFTLDRTVASLGTHEEGDHERRAYWHSRTPQERLMYMEHLRRMNYGHAARQRLQRVLELVESCPGLNTW